MPLAKDYRPRPCFPALGDGFFDVVAPADFPRRVLRFRNQRWAERIGLGELDATEWERHFARLVPLERNLREPIALRYHGHQFMAYNPHLGDGRGFLFAQLLDRADDRLLDLGTKGSGRTPWSRTGDGRLTLKGGVRELLATEMLEALGVNTSKTMSLFETGEQLERGDEPSPTRSSVLVRLSHSHIRIGSFQRHAYHGDAQRLRRLVDFSIEHYAPELARRGEDESVIALLREVCRRNARLCASWMVAGFVHGVLNTDNLNITGESFDYGPYRFLPLYDPKFVAAYFDPAGVYAFGRQPAAVEWALGCLAEALGQLCPRPALAAALERFRPEFEAALAAGFLERLGLSSCGADRDRELVALAYTFLHESRVGYDQFFFDWYGGAASEARSRSSPEAVKYGGEAFALLRAALDRHAPSAPERLADPYFQRERPTSLLIDEVESIWASIAERDDWAPLECKVAEVRAMGSVYGRGGA
jgi:uncharacterized protein YdiU (UPF0061 family)